MNLYGICPICFGTTWDSVGNSSVFCSTCGFSATNDEVWGKTSAPIPAPEARPAQPENCNAPLDYDERDFAVTLSSRIFAKDIIRGRTDGDVGRRDYKRKQNMDALIASLRR